MESEFDSKALFFIDTKPCLEDNANIKRKISDTDECHENHDRKHRRIENRPKKRFNHKKKNPSFEVSKKEEKEHASQDSDTKAAIAYYENVLKDLKNGIDREMRNEVICNILKDSEGKEVDLSCHGLVSHCLEMLLTECEDNTIVLRFMSAFAENKITVCTSANASHITELLIHQAVKALKNYQHVINAESGVEDPFVIHCINWLVDFGNFAVENLVNCLYSQYSCHVVCTLIGALAGDLAGIQELMSKSLKNHKKEFRSQFTEMDSSARNQDLSSVVLEQIPKIFADLLKALYKTLVNSEAITDFINDSSSAAAIEALIFALRKRCPKACKKMIIKLSKRMFLKRNKDDVPLCLVHKTASFVFHKVFEAADESLQLSLWNEYISDHVENLVIDPIGNFVIQRLCDAINSKTVFEAVCKHMWSAFHKVVQSQNYGIFVSISAACNRLNAQQSFFMENIMQCLECYKPVERQVSLIPLLLGFGKYNAKTTKHSPETQLKICLQGSLVAQAILKFQKPIKAVTSILSMSPEEIEFLSGHIQGCHVLNAFFGSITVGDKNKEKLLHHLQPVLVSMACDRNKSHTLSRMWISLSLKQKEIIARHLAQHQQTIKDTSCGYGIYQKFGISRFRNIQEWKEIQSKICTKKPQNN